jgi:hypothetical protein
MGRPINKKFFVASGGSAAAYADGTNLPIRFKTGGSVYEGYILKQRGSRRFKCVAVDGTTTATCVLVDGSLTAGPNTFDPANNGECVITGFQSTSQVQRSIRRITNRIAWDYTGLMHKWSLQDDSTQTIIVLTRP